MNVGHDEGSTSEADLMSLYANPDISVPSQQAPTLEEGLASATDGQMVFLSSTQPGVDEGEGPREKLMVGREGGRTHLAGDPEAAVLMKGVKLQGGGGTMTTLNVTVKGDDEEGPCVEVVGGAWKLRSCSLYGGGLAGTIVVKSPCSQVLSLLGTTLVCNRGGWGLTCQVGGGFGFRVSG
jgi:hypothetical protein